MNRIESRHKRLMLIVRHKAIALNAIERDQSATIAERTTFYTSYHLANSKLIKSQITVNRLNADIELSCINNYQSLNKGF